NGAFHNSSVADIAAQQFDAVKPQMSHASLRPVQDAHADAPVEQRLHQVAADEAGSAGHKNGTANRTHGADTFAIRITVSHYPELRIPLPGLPLGVALLLLLERLDH